MGVYDSSNIFKGFVDFQMSWSIRRRLIVTFDFITIQIHNDHIISGHGLIIYAAWFDDKKTTFSVNSADIAPGEGDKSVFGKQHIGFKYFLF